MSDKVHNSESSSHEKCRQVSIHKKCRGMTTGSVLSVVLLISVVISSVKSSEMCQFALNHLVKHGVAYPELIKDLPSNGSEVCRGGPCCLPMMSEKMLVQGRHILQSSVHTTTTSLLESVTAARDTFRGAVEAALHRSEERTLESFRLSYPRLVGHAKEPLRELFASLHSSLMSKEENSVDRALDLFWDDLFPLVYHSTVHSRLQPFTHGYMECLRKSRKSIKLWNIVLSYIGPSLVRGMDTARLMVNTLNVASDVVLKASNFEIPQECGNSAARLYFCGSCQAILAEPCHGFCINVARGCLAPLAELNGVWNTMGTAAGMVNEAIQASMLAHHLKTFPEKLSDAIMVAMESGTKLQKMVRNKCGPYSHEPSSEWEARTQEGLSQKRSEASSLLETDSDVEGDALNAQAIEAARILSEARNVWRKLADKTCSKYNRQIQNCWNGDKVATYSRQVAKIGITAQKYNPEIQILKPDNTVHVLAEQMRNAKRTISKVLSWMPESAALRSRTSELVSSEGSGFGPNTDDEDGEDDGLGSGSYPTLNNFNAPDDKDLTEVATQGTSHATSSSVLILVLTSSILYLRRPTTLIL